MLLLTYLFPIGVLATIGHYYFRLYQQGKAAGVGMMAILQAATHEQLERYATHASTGRERHAGGRRPGERPTSGDRG